MDRSAWCRILDEPPRLDFPFALGIKSIIISPDRGQFQMPSFHLAERWVRDRNKPEAVRMTAFCWALESYVWLTGQKFHLTFRRLGSRFGFDWDRKPTGDQMEQALDVLDCERERLKARLARFAELRRVEKSEGRRQWSGAKYAWVYEPDFLEFPHPETPAT